jgi:methyl-accepting chemotaxis protein
MGGASGPWYLAPVLAAVDRLRASARLGVLVVVLLVPGVYAATSYLGAIGGQTHFTSMERAGTEVLPPALYALADTVAGQKPDLSALVAAAEEHPELALDEALAAVKQQVDALPATPAAAQRVPVAEALVALVTEIGNTSNLILDPDLDSFYVMDSQIVQVPRLLLAAAKAAAPTRPGADANLVAELAVRAGELSSAAGAVGSDISTAAETTTRAGLEERLTGLGRTGEAAGTLAGTITDSLQTPRAADAGAVAAAAKAGTAEAVRALDDLLDVRLNGFNASRTRTVTVMVVGLALAAWLAAAVWWRTRRDVRLAVSGVTAIADGDMAPRLLPTGRDEFGDIGRAITTARATLAAQDEELRRAHAQREEQVHVGVARQRLSDAQFRARAQSAVDETATVVVDELRDVVSQVDAVRGAAGTINDRIGAANDATRTVVEHAQRADQVVGALEASLHRVASMARVITGIAAQTRLLALNATIEAARAGETGRGFTVVANEVKDLAVTTAESTKQITDTIASLEQDAANMASTIATMVEAIGRVDEVTAVLNGVANDQYAVVERLNTRVEQTVAKVHEMAQLSERLEQRRHERVPAVDTVTLVLPTGRSVAELSDLSEEGLGCRVERDSAVNMGVKLRVELSLESGVVQVPGQVVHTQRAGNKVQIGIEFAGLDPATATRIADHLATLRTAAFT